MKSVISASRRTDIPAYYLHWFMEKIREGAVTIQNPFYKTNYKKVDLTPRSVEWIVFWSRNYSNFLRHSTFFNAYRLFFHFTVVSHHPFLEKVNMSPSKVLGQMEKLVTYFGSDKIIWRYDPIVCWQDRDSIESNYDAIEFKRYCQEFSTMGIDKCYFSYVTDYSKFRKRFNSKFPDKKIVPAGHNKIHKIVGEMRRISAEYDITLYSCCNDLLIGTNTEKGSCISGSLLNNLTGRKIVSEAKAPTRNDCGCTRSIDIGDYHKQPCYFGCIYCYANPVWR